MKAKENVAKIIRVVSVPPVMISALLIILYVVKGEYFRNPLELVIAILLLGVVPVSAYPLQLLIPKLKEQGRDGQRKLAFITNLIGYVAAFLWAFLIKVSAGLLLICSTYFFSVIFLTICNVMHFKASGHASSFTGPLLILVYAIGWKMVIPCTIIAIAIIWSSLELKRHTMKQLIAGMGVCAISFAFSVLLIHMI